VDHTLNARLNLFGRYDYSPSKISQRGAGSGSLSTVIPTAINTQTGTLGLTWAISTAAANDFRFNYSSTDAASTNREDSFGGAVPLGTLPFPSPFTASNGGFTFQLFALGDHSALLAGANAHNRQRQFNILDSLSLQKSSHNLKFGLDYRRLSPDLDPAPYQQANFVSDMASAETGTLFFSVVISNVPATVLFRNLGGFAQDTWRVVPRLTMTYGLRWDVDLAPSSIRGPNFNAVTGLNLNDLSSLALAPAGAPPYKTRWGNLAPRIGLAYQVSDSQNWQTVLRGGFGVFYDLASSEAGTGATSSFSFPFGSQKRVFGPIFGGPGTFPLSTADAASQPIAAPDASNGGKLFAVDPHLELPYTLQWNVALEQALGKQQTVSASYIGATGRRLIQTADIFSPNGSLSEAQLVTNAATSDYHALQLQFQRRLSRGLQALASYPWSHSLDTASGGSTGSGSNVLSSLDSKVNRGPSDFDVRHTFSIALTYDVPAPGVNAVAKAILRGWSTENTFQHAQLPRLTFFTTP
jgi:hypothetical protein